MAAKRSKIKKRRKVAMFERLETIVDDIFSKFQLYMVQVASKNAWWEWEASLIKIGKLKPNVLFCFLWYSSLLAQSPERPFVAGAPPEGGEPVVGEMVEVLNPYITIFNNFRPGIDINALIWSPIELKIKDFLKRPRCSRFITRFCPFLVVWSWRSGHISTSNSESSARHQIPTQDCGNGYWHLVVERFSRRKTNWVEKRREGRDNGWMRTSGVPQVGA